MELISFVAMSQTQIAVERSWKNRQQQEALVTKVRPVQSDLDEMPVTNSDISSLVLGPGEIQVRLHPHQQLQRTPLAHPGPRHGQGHVQAGESAADGAGQ